METEMNDPMQGQMHDMHDMNTEMMVDGNAVAGMMQEMFGTDMTATPAECANCGAVSEMGQLKTFTHAPGTVMRCPACGQVMMSIVETPEAMHLDVRGISKMVIARVARIAGWA